MPAQRKYSPELIERAVRMVVDKQCETPGRQGIIREVGDLLGIHRAVDSTLWGEPAGPVLPNLRRHHTHPHDDEPIHVEPKQAGIPTTPTGPSG